MTSHLNSTIRLRLMQVACALWASLGLAVLGWSGYQFGGEFFSSSLLLVGILSVLVFAYLRVEIPFGHRNVAISPDGQPLLIAILFLRPHEAVLLVLATSIIADIWDHDGWVIHIFNALSAASATAVVAFLVHEVVPSGPGPQTILLVGLGVALAWDLIYTGWFGVFLEARGAGSAREFYGWFKNILGYQVALNVSGLMVAGPFVDRPILMASMLIALLGITSAALRVANNEQLQSKRNEYMLDTFSRYVPSEIVKDNLEQMAEIHLGGESRDITVLFCDIRGFTSWSEDREAAEIITELNVLLTQLGDSVMETEGTLDKYMGDGLMAFWGAPLEQPDHAERACRAALWMLQRLDVLNDERVRNGQVPFAIGIGVHTGKAVVGNVGHERRLDYTAIGDTVNTAARLEAATKDIGSVLAISAQTVELLSAELRHRAVHVGPVQVKGRQKPVEVWALQPLRHHGLGEPELDVA